MRKNLYFFLSGLLVFGLAGIVFAGMGSENFTIKKSVFSGGGAPMSSASYQNVQVSEDSDVQRRMKTSDT